MLEHHLKFSWMKTHPRRLKNKAHVNSERNSFHNHCHENTIYLADAKETQCIIRLWSEYHPSDSSLSLYGTRRPYQEDSDCTCLYRNGSGWYWVHLSATIKMWFKLPYLLIPSLLACPSLHTGTSHQKSRFERPKSLITIQIWTRYLRHNATIKPQTTLLRDTNVTSLLI